MDNTEKFWLNDPSVLFRNLNLIPNSDMTNSERLNALTRLLIVITIGMYFLGYDNYFTVLILGILLIIILRSNQPKEHFQPEITNAQALQQGIRQFDPTYDSKPHVPVNKACWFDQDTDLLNAAFEITPPIQFNHDDAAKRSYMNAKYELTPLTDTEGFKDIWRNEPEMCGGYSMIPDPLTTFPVESGDSRGQCNYIVRSKVDHLPISQGSNGMNAVRASAEAAYTASCLAFRDGIMNEHIDRFTRERKHGCPDMKLNSFHAGSGSSV